MFKSFYQEFKKMLKLTNIELTEEQKTYILQRTFAAYFMMNGGNILVLQKNRTCQHSRNNEVCAFST